MKDVSIPSRGFWFFEEIVSRLAVTVVEPPRFNPLAGILVF